MHIGQQTIGIGESGKSEIRTDTEMGVDGGIASSASEVLVLSIRDVEVSLRVTILLGQSKVDNIDLISTFANAHQEVVRLDITVDERLGVDVLNTGDELIRQEENGLQGEFPVAEVEQILQAGSEEVQDHGIVITLGAEPADEGNANAAGERLVDPGLILELGVLGLDTLQFDGDLLTGDDVSSQVDITKGTRANLAANAVFVTDAEILQAGKR